MKQTGNSRPLAPCSVVSTTRSPESSRSSLVSSDSMRRYSASAARPRPFSANRASEPSRPSTLSIRRWAAASEPAASRRSSYSRMSSISVRVAATTSVPAVERGGELGHHVDQLDDPVARGAAQLVEPAEGAPRGPTGGTVGPPPAASRCSPAPLAARPTGWAGLGGGAASSSSATAAPIPGRVSVPPAIAARSASHSGACRACAAATSRSTVVAPMPAGRVVDHAAQRELVAEVERDPQVRDHVLDLLALEELLAAVHHVRDAGLAQLVLQQLGLEVRAVHDRDVAPPPAVVVEPGDLGARPSAPRPRRSPPPRG